MAEGYFEESVAMGYFEVSVAKEYFEESVAEACFEEFVAEGYFEESVVKRYFVLVFKETTIVLFIICCIIFFQMFLTWKGCRICFPSCASGCREWIWYPNHVVDKDIKFEEFEQVDLPFHFLSYPVIWSD